jgi:predicted amidohydrolase
MRFAAIQMKATVADVDANLAQASDLVAQAADAGADWIVLPEFFTTGIAFEPRLADCALAPDGAFLAEQARRHGKVVGGSLLVRDDDGHVRNAFFLATPEDGVVGRHDKDLPTMWENAFYVGGDDDGVMHARGLDVGAAVCWEFMRSQTARRLRDRVDVVLGGSGWWSIPEYPGTARMEAANERQAVGAPIAFARLVGAPVVHASHAGRLACPGFGFVLPYRGHFEGGASITAADGTVLAQRSWREGAGVVVADLEPARRPPLDEVPARFWLHRRSPLAVYAWNVQRHLGRRHYERFVRTRRPSPGGSPGHPTR